MSPEGNPRVIRLLASVVKELRLIVRDREALLLLFLMPLVFVLMMSMALHAPINDRAGNNLLLLLLIHDDGAIGKTLTEYFVASRQFEATLATSVPATL